MRVHSSDLLPHLTYSWECLCIFIDIFHMSLCWSPIFSDHAFLDFPHGWVFLLTSECSYRRRCWQVPFHPLAETSTSIYWCSQQSLIHSSHEWPGRSFLGTLKMYASMGYVWVQLTELVSLVESRRQWLSILTCRPRSLQHVLDSRF